MQNYQTWTNDPDVNKMVSVLNMAGSERNVTELLDNVDLKISSTSYLTAFDWSYTYNGADYPSVNLELKNMYGYSISFSDNRGIYSIGNTTIAVSKQQAFNIAENYVKNYSYQLNYVNGTIITINNLDVNETSTQASLATTNRNQTTLYPYWTVEVTLDHTYPGNTKAIIVKVWADTGTVFQAQREVGPIPFSNIVSQLIFAQVLIFAVSIIVAVVVILAVVLIIVYSTDKQKQPNSDALRNNRYAFSGVLSG
jgi:hypothetical protein